jgi:hypothetical protein
MDMNKESAPETYNKVYGTMVRDEIHLTYSEDEIEAITLNYLSDPSNKKYEDEMHKLQECRENAKQTVRSRLGIEV